VAAKPYEHGQAPAGDGHRIGSAISGDRDRRLLRACVELKIVSSDCRHDVMPKLTG